MKGENYVWIVTAIPDVNSTSDWWIPEPSNPLACTRSQMEEALDHHFTFYFKNQIRGTLVSGKVCGINKKLLFLGHLTLQETKVANMSIGSHFRL